MAKMKLKDLLNVDLTGRNAEFKADVLKQLSQYANRRLNNLLSDKVTKYSSSAQYYKKGFKTSINIRRGKGTLSEKNYNQRVMNEIERVRNFLDNESSTMKGARKNVKNQVEGLLGKGVKLTNAQRKKFFKLYTRIKEMGDVNSLYNGAKGTGSPVVAKVIHERMIEKGKSKDIDDMLNDIQDRLDTIYQEREQTEQEILEDLEDYEQSYTTSYKFK